MPDVPGPPVAVTNTPLPGPLAVCRLMANVTWVVLPVSWKWSSGTVSVTHSKPSAMSLAHGLVVAVAPGAGDSAAGDWAAVGPAMATTRSSAASTETEREGIGPWYGPHAEMVVRRVGWARRVSAPAGRAVSPPAGGQANEGGPDAARPRDRPLQRRYDPPSDVERPRNTRNRGSSKVSLGLVTRSVGTADDRRPTERPAPA